ncbi:PepSY-like domain-containing protein [Robertkochia solimangrovi]|uniref:PepSY-like domain-containing protein n=1 Tax=Robertkochia solimangrovi TaxID=2213046 RepID=UPI00117E9796|nr:PepSY-like domain-containing protein [Robertkochia solimangrovi]TRZ42954.1 hypothetical protein DMZ48_12895 [Robertkochia solimangrovi]
MKTLKVILGAFLTISLLAFIKAGDKVPEKVRQAFTKKFPTVNKVKWEKENEREWEAEFKLNKVEYSANFLVDGTWQETEHEIDETEVPQQVNAALISAFPGYEVEEVEISESYTGIVYEFEIEKGESDMEVTIDAAGKIIKKESIEKDEEKD